jgi:capsular polysaccharide biosynthesis protein
MLETRSSQDSFDDDEGQNLDLQYLTGIVKRRIFYFIVPFLLVALAGAAVIKILPKTYRAEGQILVESPAVAPDLVRPTITELAGERFAIFKERVMAANNLLAIVDKFNLFPGQRASLSQSRLIDLVRSRVDIKPVPLQVTSNVPTFTFSVAFEYELPDIALKVAHELLTEILNEDTSRRTSSAAETTRVLEQEVSRLKDQHDALLAQIETLKQRPPDQRQAASEQAHTQMQTLAALEAELTEKSAVYSDQYPSIKALKLKIAALKRAIAAAPAPTPATADNQLDKSDNVATQALVQQEKDLGKNLEDANQKLTIARLGENLEKNQEAEHLQVISYPDLPDRPIRPNKLKLFAEAIAAAVAAGAGVVFAAEMFDGTIRRPKDLAKVFNKHLIVTIPYLSTAAEERRKRLKFIALSVCLLGITAGAIVGIMSLHPGL